MKDTLRSIYFGNFSSVLTYALQIWSQIKNRAIQILNYANFCDSVSPRRLQKYLKYLII